MGVNTGPQKAQVQLQRARLDLPLGPVSQPLPLPLEWWELTWFGLKYSAEWSGRCKDLSPGHVHEDAQVGQREDGGWLTKDPLFIFSGADAN